VHAQYTIPAKSYRYGFTLIPIGENQLAAELARTE